MLNSALKEYDGCLDEVDMEDARNGSQASNDDEEIEAFRLSKELKQPDLTHPDAEGCSPTNVEMSLI